MLLHKSRIDRRGIGFGDLVVPPDELRTTSTIR